MNYEQLKELAKGKAFVRWSPSGAVEMLRWSENGTIQAVNLVYRIEHMILRRRKKEYHCVEVPADALVSLGSLLPVRSMLKHRPHRSPIFDSTE